MSFFTYYCVLTPFNMYLFTVPQQLLMITKFEINKFFLLILLPTNGNEVFPAKQLIHLTLPSWHLPAQR